MIDQDTNQQLTTTIVHAKRNFSAILSILKLSNALFQSILERGK